MIIAVNEHINNGFSNGDAQIIEPLIRVTLESSDKVILDFSGVSFFTTLFFNRAIVKFVSELTPEVYDNRIILKNLSKVGQSTYEHSYENAIEYFNLSKEERIKMQNIVSDDIEI